MLNTEYPNFEKKKLDHLELTLYEPIKKINIRGKKKRIFYKNRKDFINHLTNRTKYKFLKSAV